MSPPGSRGTHSAAGGRPADGAGGKAGEGKELEVQPGSFLDQYTFASQISSGSTCSTVGELSSSEFLSRQCTEIDALAQVAWSDSALEDAVRAATAECRFSVTVADPRRADFPLIAVSQVFEAMTGFRREEIVGKNCRFLNYGCDIEPAKQQALREASRTGAPFTALLLNRRKSGDLFLNFLDLRGLVVAHNPRTGAELWFLVGIQADVTGLAEEDYPEDHLAELSHVASAIRRRITAGLTSFAMAGALAAEARKRPAEAVTPTLSAEAANEWRASVMYPLHEPRWRDYPPLTTMQREAEAPRAPAEPAPLAKAPGRDERYRAPRAPAEPAPSAKAPGRDERYRAASRGSKTPAGEAGWPVEQPSLVSGLVLGAAAVVLGALVARR